MRSGLVCREQLASTQGALRKGAAYQPPSLLCEEKHSVAEQCLCSPGGQTALQSGTLLYPVPLCFAPLPEE